jgi:hypothetical protein
MLEAPNAVLLSTIAALKQPCAAALVPCASEPVHTATGPGPTLALAFRRILLGNAKS